MKKKLLLLIPALMALSACNGAQPVENNTFLEDTEAHAELFGGENDSGELKAKRNAIDLSGEDLPIAYQIKYTEATDKLAIRFVAAVKNLEVKAEWKRGVAGAAGGDPLQDKGFDDDAQEATKYYTTLSDGNTTIEAKKGDYAAYNGFVVYTLYNIPYTANANAYVAAYLNIYENGNTSNNTQSKVFAVKIEKLDNYTSKNTFSFIHSDYASGKHFLQGTINGEANTILNATEHAEGGNSATYDDKTFNISDSFGSFYYCSTIFQYFGYDTYVSGSAGDFFSASSLSGYMTPKATGQYTIYISRGAGYENKVYASSTATVTISFHADLRTKGDVTAWGGVVYIVGAFCDWKTSDANAILLAETSANSKIWEGSTSWTLGATYSYKIRLDSADHKWGDENNWYPSGDDKLYHTVSGAYTINLSW